MKPTRAAWVVMMGLALALAPSAASAQNPSSEARAAFQEGVAHYGARRFAEALVSFQRAYRVRPHPSVMVNIANCYSALDQPQEAVSWFERYLSDPAVQPAAQQRAEIERQMAEARARLASLTILAQPAGAEVYVDGTLIGVAPLRGARPVGAGPHVLEARVPGGVSVQFQTQLEPGRSLTVTLDAVRRQSYMGSTPPGANDAALVALAPPPRTLVAPAVTSAAAHDANVVAPPVIPTEPPRLAPVAPVVVTPTPSPRETRADEVTVRRRSGFVPAVVVGSLVTAVGFGTAIGVILYNAQWINEYNDFGVAYEYYRTRDAARAITIRAQGQEHLRVINQNETFATVGYVVGGLGAAFTLGALLFWPRETVVVQRSSVSLHVVPTLQGVGLVGTF